MGALLHIAAQPELRRCQKCGVDRPASAFYARGVAHCRPCERDVVYAREGKLSALPEADWKTSAAGARACMACGEEKPIAEFYRRDGRMCQPCHQAKRKAYKSTDRAKAKAAEWKAANPDHAREWRSRNYVRFMVSTTRYRAKKNGIPFDITIKDITIPVFCPILGIKLAPGVGGSCDSSPTLDRIVPERGYVRGNVAVISNRANRLKSNATAEQLRLIADWIERNGG